MFQSRSISYEKAGILNPLVLNYLWHDEQLRPFYNHAPNIDGLRSFLEKKPYAHFGHEQLSNLLLAQSKTVGNSSAFTTDNILLLKEKNTYTVTTGHQLCLFTGPLYFIYKIISTINLAERLKIEFPEFNFVPVYWMASEDHDFEEVSAFNAFGKKLRWESSQKGAVGDFETAELKNLFTEFSEILGSSENAVRLISLFESSYLQHKTLAQATRFLVNELFGNYGLVTLDGNDKAFKEQFREIFRQDIFGNSCFRFVSETIEQLKKIGFEPQVNPRPINCFYLEKGARYRIEKSNERYQLVGTGLSFSESEINDIIENRPEVLSPNVVLRPLYQQHILPNLAYVGGPGELAYWLEFKKMFSELKVELPVLVPRDFVALFDKGTHGKIEKLNFEPEAFFGSETELFKEFQARSNALFEVEVEKEALGKIFEQLSRKVGDVDKSLSANVAAEKQKAINSLEMISGKANKALKQKSETELNQIRAVKQKIFPEGIPQERYDNFTAYYLRFGPAFLEELKSKLDPFDQVQKLLIEE